MKKINIGIPNRSSFIHISGIIQCISAGLIEKSEYHPAKLFYSNEKANIYLLRNDQLCNQLLDKKLDYVYTGDDYAYEIFANNIKKLLSVDIFKTKVCILYLGKLHKRVNIYTKFPNIANKYLELWKIKYNKIIKISGSCETYCFLNKDSATIDTVCTGGTKNVNKLISGRCSQQFSTGWYGCNHNKSLIDSLAENNRAIIKSLKQLYKDELLNRDNKINKSIIKFMRNAKSRARC